MPRVAGTIRLGLDTLAPSRQHFGRRRDAPPLRTVVAPAGGEPQLDRIAQALAIDAGTAIDGTQHRDALVGHRPPVTFGDEMKPRLHVPAGDGVERPGEPVAEAAPHVAAIQHHGARLTLGAGRHVVFEGFFEPRHVARLGAFFGGVLAPGDAPEQVLSQTPRLVGGDASVAPDDDALVGRLAPAVAGAVVDDEGLGARRLDAETVPGELVVPGDPGLLGRLQGLDGALGQGRPDFCNSFSRIFHDGEYSTGQLN